MAFDFKTFGTPKTATSTTPTAPITPGASLAPVKKSAFDFSSFGTTETAPKANKFRFEVAETRDEKKARINAAVARDNAEFQKEMGVRGFAKNFGKAFVGTIAGSEVGFGQTIGSILNVTGGNLDKLSKAKNDLETQKTQLLKDIRDKKARGEDVTKLQKIYNSTADLADEVENHIAETTAGSQKTTGQVAGEIGGVALDLLASGSYGKAAQGAKSGKLLVTGKASAKAATLLEKAGIQSTESAAVKATRAGVPSVLPRGTAGLFTKEGAKDVLKGGITGYAGDVFYGLQGKRGEDRTGENALIPGLGTGLGVGIPTAIHGIQSTKNLISNVKNEGVIRGVKDSIVGPMSEARKAKIIEKRVEILDQLEGNNARVRKQMAGNQAQEAKKILASTDILQGSVDDTGTIHTKGAIQELNDFIKPTEDVVYKNLEREGNKIPLKQVEKSLREAIDKSGLEGGALERAYGTVDADLAGYARRADANGMIPVASIHNAKVDKYANINYLNPESNRVDKIIAKQLKALVEDNTSSVDVAAINKELSKYYAVQKLLETLEGKKVQGGKLGKYFAQTVGGLVGSHFGPIGTIIGAEVGGKIKGASLASNFADATGNELQQSDLIKDAVQKANSPRLGLPAPQPGAPQSSNFIPRAMGPAGSIEPAATVVNNPGVTFRGTGQENILGNRNITQSISTKNPIAPSIMSQTVQNAVDGVNDLPTRSPSGLDITDTVNRKILAMRDMYETGIKEGAPASGVYKDVANKILTKEMADHLIDDVAGDLLGGPQKHQPGIIKAISEIADPNNTTFDKIAEAAKAVRAKATEIVGKESVSPAEAEFLRKILGKSASAGKASVGAILAGAAATGAALGLKKIPSATINYEREKTAIPEKPASNLTSVSTSDVNDIREAIAHNETRGESDAYKFARPSGAKYLGRALGRYQITEGELKTYADRFLGQSVTAATFLRSPQLQDQYIENKIKYFIEKGLPLEKILVAHRGGFSDFDALDSKLAQYGGYVDEGVSKYKNLKSNAGGK